MKKTIFRIIAIVLVALIYLSFIAVPLISVESYTAGGDVLLKDFQDSYFLFRLDGAEHGAEVTQDTTYLLTFSEFILELILIAILVAACVFLFIKRAKVAAGVKVYENEAKRVSWLSWDQTKKSTWAVLVVLLVCAVVICLVDLGLSKGFLAIIDVFSK